MFLDMNSLIGTIFCTLFPPPMQHRLTLSFEIGACVRECWSELFQADPPSMPCVVPELYRSQRHHCTWQSMDLNVLSRPLGHLYENVFGRSDNIVAGTGVFWKSIEFDNGSIDEACESAKAMAGNIPRATLTF